MFQCVQITCAITCIMLSTA